MLELIFQGFMEWAYGLALECWEYFSSSLLDIMSMDYEAYQPGYGGDGSYSGDVEYGSGYDNKIDISGFVDPSTKNNLDLASYAIQAWANNWGYVWGTYGNVLTPALFEYKKQQ